MVLRLGNRRATSSVSSGKPPVCTGIVGIRADFSFPRASNFARARNRDSLRNVIAAFACWAFRGCFLGCSLADIRYIRRLTAAPLAEGLVHSTRHG